MFPIKFRCKHYCLIFTEMSMYSIMRSIKTGNSPKPIHAGDILGVENYLIHFKDYNGKITYLTPSNIRKLADVFINKNGKPFYSNCIHVDLKKLKESEKNINKRKRRYDPNAC